mmetsp:Transcript_92020/g.162403  ORF Transcript_92020/g.162403 Transcript_92020/m.162403 type:complete len:159 (-) Transcript_92020:267-743(-)
MWGCVIFLSTPLSTTSADNCKERTRTVLSSRLLIDLRSRHGDKFTRRPVVVVRQEDGRKRTTIAAACVQTSRERVQLQPSLRIVSKYNMLWPGPRACPGHAATGLLQCLPAAACMLLAVAHPEHIFERLLLQRNSWYQSSVDYHKRQPWEAQCQRKVL